MKYKLLIILFLTSINKVYPQDYVDIASLRKAYSPEFGLGSAQSQKNNTEYLFTGINIPLQFKKIDMVVTISPYYENWLINSYDSLNFNLKGIGFPISVNKKINEKWSSSTTLFFRKNTSDLSTNFSTQIGVLSTLNYMVNDKFKIKPGLYYNKEFWGNFFLPIIGIEYYPNNKLKIWGNVPANLFVERKMNKNWYLSFILRGVNNSYTLNEKEYLYINETQLGIVSDWYFFKNFVVAIEAGHSLFRNIRTGQMKLDRAYILEENMRNNAYFRLSTSYRIRLQ
ncbi:MAG: DUF6268 family outer membrane beta-barrel protein [bacterium]